MGPGWEEVIGKLRSAVAAPGDSASPSHGYKGGMEQAIAGEIAVISAGQQ